MAVMGKTNNWNEVAERLDGRELLPKGAQNIIFVSNENKETKQTNPITGNKGNMIVITAMIEGGPLHSKLIYENLNWDCAPKDLTQEAKEKAEQAEKIAEKTASNIAKAIGITAFNGDIDQFNNKRCIVDIDQVPGKNGYGPSNTFRYRALGSAGTAPMTGAAANAGSAAPANPFAPKG